MSQFQTNLRIRRIVDLMLGHQRPPQPSDESDRWRAIQGIDYDSLLRIISILLPMIIECFDPDNAQQAKQYVDKRFDENARDNRYYGYDKRLVKATARQAKRAARRSGIRITWDQSYELAAMLLDDVRDGDTAQADIIISEYNATNMIARDSDGRDFDVI